MHPTGIAEVLAAVIPVEVFAALAGFYVFTYTGHRFVEMKLKNTSTATLGQVRVVLRKRLDLITSLAEAVGSYAGFEGGPWSWLRSWGIYLLGAT